MAKKKIDLNNESLCSDVDEFVGELTKTFNTKKPEQCDFYISTGSTLLDYMISNTKDGGIPGGRLTEITGEEASGKTLVASHIAANTQKKGGIAVYFDQEHALKKDFMERLGVKWDKLVKPQVTTIEEVFETIEKIINVTRTKFPNKERPVTIIWDSLAATPPQAEIEGDYDPASLMGVAPKAMAKGLRKLTEVIAMEYVTMVFLNQLKTNYKVTNPYMDPWIAPYGKAVPFHASVRVRLLAGSKIKDSVGDIIGISTKAKVIKNRMGPPHRQTQFPIMFDWGVDNVQSIYDYLHDIEQIKKAGGKSKFNLNNQDYIFEHNEWRKFFEDHKNDIMNFLDKRLIKTFDPSEVSASTEGCEDAIEELIVVTEK